MHKDIRLALEAAGESGFRLLAASMAGTALRPAEEMGYGHRDIAGLFQVLVRMAPPRGSSGAGPKAA